MPTKKPQIIFTVTEEMEKQINLKAAQLTNGNVSELMRMWCKQGIEGQVAKDNLDLIYQTQEELFSRYFKIITDRIAAMVSTGVVESVTTSLLAAEAINRFVDVKYQEDFDEVYKQARKKAIATLRSGNAKSEN